MGTLIVNPYINQTINIPNPVLDLDAGNLLSYPGYGTTWTDLSGNGNNGTLINGVGYDESYGGVLTFDGDDYVDAGNNSSLSFTNSLTVQIWCSLSPAASSYRSPLMKTTSTAWTDGFGFFHAPTNPASFTFFINQWNGAHRVSISKTAPFSLTHFVGTYDGANLKLYENGNLKQTGLSYTANVSNSTGNLQIGRAYSGYRWVGNIAQVSIYNKALTALEVQQNFNALRGRYGI